MINQLRNEVEDMKQEIEKAKKELEAESFAMQLTKSLKLSNTRLFIIWIITFVALMISVIYNMYLLSDIGVVEDTYQSIENVETIDNSNISNGGE